MSSNNFYTQDIIFHDDRNQQGGSSNTVLLNYEKVSEKTYNSQRIHRQSLRQAFKITHNLSDFVDLFSVEEEIDEAFNKIISAVTNNASAADIISITISHSNLFSPIYSMRKISNYKHEDILNSIYKICQSSKAFLLDGLLDFEIVLTRAIRGSGRNKRAIPISNEEYRKKKKCIIEMKNKDHSCGYRAIALGTVYAISSDKDEKTAFQRDSK